MATQWIDPTAFERDGTSQVGRFLQALSPDYVQVDERTAAELVDFSREYGKTLRFFDINNQDVSDFSAFLGSLSSRDVAAFLDNPQAFNPDRDPLLFRPHFTLFAVFLKLLQRAQANLNTLTRRHLDYHFRRFLQMQPRAAVPDRVNLVFSLADREANTLVPAGTLVSAGVDALGKDRLYKTTTNLVVNRAQIEKVSSVFVEREIIGVADSWHGHRNNATDGRFEMLRIAYGRPLPGDPLPSFKSTVLAVDKTLVTNTELDNCLVWLKSLTKLSKTMLGLSPAELRSFVALTEPDNNRFATMFRIEQYRNQTKSILAAKQVDPETFAIPGDTVTPPLASSLGWQKVTFALPTGAESPSVGQMVATAAGDVFVVRTYKKGTVSYSQVARYEPGAWNAQLAQHEKGAWIQVGTADLPPINSIWAHSREKIFAVGANGKVMHYNGASWTTTSPTTVSLSGVWGSEPDEESGENIFAVGANGTILRYNGTAWTSMPSPVDNGLSAVWGTGAKDVFAVGTYGVILHYNGTKWEQMTSGSAATLFHVTGSSSKDVFAVGTNGTILHYNETSWTTMPSPTNATLYGLWERAPNDVFAVGNFSTILHYDGDSWKDARTGSIWAEFRTVGGFGLYLHFIGHTSGDIYRHVSYSSLQRYWNALREVETYFAMPIESFDQLLDKILVEGNAWDTGYEHDSAFVAALLEQAHHDKLRSERRAALKTSRESKALDFAYSAILQETLFGEIDPLKGSAFVPEFEDALRTHLTDLDAKKLHHAALAGDWDTVLDLLAHAMTLRIGKAPPRKAIWQNIHRAEDARTVLATRSKVDAEGNQPFSTFGAPQENAEPMLGFAVTSPILELSAGTRKVTLTLGLRASGFEFDELKKVFANDFCDVDHLGRNLSPLAIEVSTAKGWLRVTPDKALSKFGTYDTLTGVASTWGDHANAPGLQLVFTLAEGDSAVAPLPNPPDGMDGRYPAMRLLMQPVWSETENRYVTYYRELTSLFVGAVHLKVTVAGLLPTAIENDESILDPKKPFEPFGSLPVVGSRLSFGHPEIVTKKIDRLKCEFLWAGKPADLTTHYANYGITPTFTTNVHWSDITGTKQISASNNLFTGNAFDLQIAAPMASDHAAVTKTSFSGRVKTWRRYVQWELQAPDFQHSVYASKAAEMAMKLSVDLAMNTVTKETVNGKDVPALGTYQVKPPYTPKLASLKLGYDASVEILLFPKSAGDRLDRTYHVHPFGLAELRAERISDELSFLPRYDAESELCIGLANVALPETVTILVRVDEGSADRDIEAPVVRWSQLSGNRWIPLGHRVLRDETQGLQRSGVVALSLEKAAPSTMLPAHLTWVRASIAQDHASICDTRALHTQAVLATFEDRGNAPEHYRARLPGKTITKLQSPIAGIVGLAQPDPSFGGRPSEDERVFTTRVSERLRHKQRALSTWDYERIVLDAFPQIFKAKCIPMPEDEPGRVDVLVLPDVRALPTNELGPKAPIAMLGEIEAFLQARVPASAQVNVRNATFRAVRLRLGVRFTEVGNDGYWMGRLNEELNRFLSPWAYDEGVDIVLGGRIHASNIVDFVDRCDYVDYVAGVTLFYTDDEGQGFTFLRLPSDDAVDKAYFVEAGGADRVLVAYPQHRIDLITTEHYDARQYRGISYMELEMDFVVG